MQWVPCGYCNIGPNWSIKSFGFVDGNRKLGNVGYVDLNGKLLRD